MTKVIGRQKFLFPGAVQERKDDKWLAKRTDKLAADVLKRILSSTVEGLTIGYFQLKANERLLLTTGDVKSYWVSRGGYIDSSQVHEQLLEPPVDVVGFHVQDFQENLREPETWRKLSELGYTSAIKEIRTRAENIRKAYFANELRSGRLHIGIWPSRTGSKGWIEGDNWYFHVLMRLEMAFAMTDLTCVRTVK